MSIPQGAWVLLVDSNEVSHKNVSALPAGFRGKKVLYDPTSVQEGDVRVVVGTCDAGDFSGYTPDGKKWFEAERKVTTDRVVSTEKSAHFFNQWKRVESTGAPLQFLVCQGSAAIESGRFVHGKRTNSSRSNSQADARLQAKILSVDSPLQTCYVDDEIALWDFFAALFEYQDPEYQKKNRKRIDDAEIVKGPVKDLRRFAVEGGKGKMWKPQTDSDVVLCMLSGVPGVTPSKANDARRVYPTLMALVRDWESVKAPTKRGKAHTYDKRLQEARCALVTSKILKSTGTKIPASAVTQWVRGILGDGAAGL